MSSPAGWAEWYQADLSLCLSFTGGKTEILKDFLRSFTRSGGRAGLGHRCDSAQGASGSRTIEEVLGSPGVQIAFEGSGKGALAWAPKHWFWGDSHTTCLGEQRGSVKE